MLLWLFFLSARYGLSLTHPAIAGSIPIIAVNDACCNVIDVYINSDDRNVILSHKKMFSDEGDVVRDLALAGMRVLVMEDEILIAMDVEQLCRDHGAAKVVLVHDFGSAGPEMALETSFDAAILDVALAGQSTFSFAEKLAVAGVPFIFATGHAEVEGLFDAFPGVAVIGKPYGEHALIEALSLAIAAVDRPSSQNI